METKDIVYDLRMKNGLSQDELAEKLYVTRQAVSRWENGETIPNTDTLKLLSKIFNVSINELLGEPLNICETCDKKESEEYCQWCYTSDTFN